MGVPWCRESTAMIVQARVRMDTDTGTRVRVQSKASIHRYGLKSGVEEAMES